MNKRIAAYAASLDPITNGHMDLIERGSRLFDEVVVIIANNHSKVNHYFFSISERLEMAERACAHLPNVRCVVNEKGYVVSCAHRMGARVLIRGVRNSVDMDAEQTLAIENRAINGEVETIWLPGLPELNHVSSSLVRSYVGADPEWVRDAERHASPYVIQKLIEKYEQGKE